MTLAASVNAVVSAIAAEFVAVRSEIPSIIIDPVDESTYPDGTIFLYTS